MPALEVLALILPQSCAFTSGLYYRLMRFGIDIAQERMDFADLIERTKRSEELGFDAVWGFDHFMPLTGEGPGNCFEGMTALAGLSAVTTTVRLGLLVTGVTHRHPSILASQAVTIDHASHGRFNLGLGCAWHGDEHYKLGIEFPTTPQRFDRLEDALEILLRLFTGEEVSYEGHHFHIDSARLRPTPVQQPHPPIWIGGPGPHRTLPLAARYADAWHAYGSPAQLRSLGGILDGLAEGCGRDPRSILHASSLSINEHPAVVQKNVVAMRDAGIDYLVCSWPVLGLKRVEQFAAEEMPRLVGLAAGRDHIFSPVGAWFGARDHSKHRENLVVASGSLRRKGGSRMNVPWVESPFFEREFGERKERLTPQQRESATRFHEDGYLEMRGLVPHELCDRVREQVLPLWDDEAKQRGRVADGWKRGAEATRELAVLEPVQEMLRTLYDRRPIPFQTLTFQHGTQQRGHTDFIHFNSFPARFMCGIWVALEDVDHENGPLFYYPGSHRLSQVDIFDLGILSDESWNRRYQAYEDFEEELMEQLGFKAVEFHAKKGDALIWSSNIVHGGMPVLRDGSTRWSQVTHVLFDDCIYYQPHSSDVPLGELTLLDITDMNTLESVPHRYYGHALTTVRLENGRSRVFMEDPRYPDISTLQRELADTKAQFADTKAQLASTDTRLKSIQGSRSWRVTKPLRRLTNRTRSFW